VKQSGRYLYVRCLDTRLVQQC